MNQPNIFDEKSRNDKYLQKWLKQIEFYFNKIREIYFYLIENKQDILRTEFTDQHPLNIKFPFVEGISQSIKNLKSEPQKFDSTCIEYINKYDNLEYKRKDKLEKIKQLVNSNQIKLCNIGLVDYDEVFDDEEEGEILVAHQQEISEESFDKICQEYLVQYSLDQLNVMATGADEATQGYRRANLLLYRTGALNPRIFVQHFKNQNYYPMVIFQRQSDSIIARFQDNLAAVNNLLGFHYIQLSEVARDKAFNKILVDTNQNQISIPQNMSQQQLQSISSSSQSIQGEIDIDILQSEILGVMKFFPIYLIHFVACNSHRYVDFFRGSFKHAFEFLKRWPCDSEAAAYYGNQILPLISMFGDKVFTAKNSLILKTQFEGEITVEEYEITFDEEPGVVLHFQKSSNISAETLKVDFIDKVINIKKEKLMKLGLKSTKGQQFKIEISQNSTIVQLKNKMEKELAFPAEQLTLVFVGKVLTNEQTLSQCGIFENATVVFFTKKQTLKLKNEQNQTRPIPQAIPSLESPTQTDAIHPNISNTTPIHTNIQQQRNGVLNPLIQQLNTHPQWDQFRQTILSDPSQFHFIIQQLAKTQPQLVQAIVENPDEFLDVFINGSDSSDSDNIPLNQLIGNPTEQTDSNHESSAASQQNMQQNQQEMIAKLSEEDKQKVTQICDMTGQSMSAAVQVYLACNKSVEEALSFLFNK